MKTRIALAATILYVALSGCSLSRMGRDRDELVTTPSPCGARRFDIYFAEDQDRLTEAARTAIGMTATQLQGCQIRSVKVLGLADSNGAAAENLSLSQRRALAVVEALSAAGWPAPAFEIAAAGDAGAMASPGVEQPLRRRTEVVVETSPL
jgi:peptidoglycan-associated lipoprotein